MGDMSTPSSLGPLSRLRICIIIVNAVVFVVSVRHCTDAVFGAFVSRVSVIRRLYASGMLELELELEWKLHYVSKIRH